jgi:protein gp138
MDRRERFYDEEETTRASDDGRLTRVWTALPGIVHAVNNAMGPNSMTVDVQPTINGRVRQPDGTYIYVQLPILTDCPIQWQGGGGVTLTFPIAEKDECLVIIASRCIDGWWATGTVCNPPEIRMHNLSDGFALVGVRSRPRAYAIPSTGARLTADDGNSYIELQPGPKIVKVVAPGGINLNGLVIDSSGNASSPGTITAATNVVAGSGGSAVHLVSHTHPSNGAPPTPGS